jgi:D-glycero-D-manno-heptose 1,7-bisphosphate phosphatase
MKAIFLDRDGTINVEFGEGKINAPDKIVLLPNSLMALKELARLDYKVFLVTNQLGIARGIYDLDRFYELNDLILKQLEPTGLKISKTYVCPHAPEADHVASDLLEAASYIADQG